MIDVALSMLTLVPGGMGGSETYARELTRQLATANGVRATAYVPSSARGFSQGIDERVIGETRGGGSTAARLRAVASSTIFGPAIRRQMASAQVVHFPFTVPVPRPKRSQAFVQTLLDVQHLDLPHLFSRAELIYRQHFYEGAARRADAIKRAGAPCASSSRAIRSNAVTEAASIHAESAKCLARIEPSFALADSSPAGRRPHGWKK
jgi:hypothetical protein